MEKSTPNHYHAGDIVLGIDWNTIPDAKDKEVWDRLTSNFWLPEKIPVSNDLKSWATLTEEEKLATLRVFTGLTVLDTIQGTVGATAILKDAQTPHEEAVYSNISFMERFSGQTQLLTPSGWKTIDTVSDKDTVMQYDPYTGEVSFTHPSAVFEPEYREATYRIESVDGDYTQVVSARHRVFVEQYLDNQWIPSTLEAWELAQEGWDRTSVRFVSVDGESSQQGTHVPAHYISATHMVVTEDKPQDMYCVQVPSTYLVTKHGDAQPVVSGNCVHAKSYSNIFMTLESTENINEAFRWSEYNEYIQEKARRIIEIYNSDDPYKKKIASVILESFLFYSGFYLPMHFSSRGKLTNTADIIRLIIRDESFVAGHELLTPQGWVAVENITPDMHVAQWDEEYGIEFVPITYMSQAEKPFTVKLSDGKTINQHVSPGHRVVFYHNDNLTEVQAQDVSQQHCGQSYVMKASDSARYDAEKLSTDEVASLALACVMDDARCIDTSHMDKEKVKETTYYLVKIGAQFHMEKNTIVVTHIPEGINVSSYAIRPLDNINKDVARNILDIVLRYLDDSRVRHYQSYTNCAFHNGYDHGYMQTVATLAGYRTENTPCSLLQGTHCLSIFDDVSDDGYVPTDDMTIERIGGKQTVYSFQVPSTYLVTRHQGIVSITGNSIHGYYIGYKYSKSIADLDEEKQQYYKDFTYDLIVDLYDIESAYTESLYDELGWTEEVKKFLRYNANKALNNLGYESLFPTESAQVSASIMSALSPSGDENHDFFSGSGSSYTIGEAEDTEDDDWDW